MEESPLVLLIVLRDNGHESVLFRWRYVLIDTNARDTMQRGVVYYILSTALWPQSSQRRQPFDAAHGSFAMPWLYWPQRPQRLLHSQIRGLRERNRQPRQQRDEPRRRAAAVVGAGRGLLNP